MHCLDSITYTDINGFRTETQIFIDEVKFIPDYHKKSKGAKVGVLLSDYKKIVECAKEFYHSTKWLLFSQGKVWCLRLLNQQLLFVVRINLFCSRGELTTWKIKDASVVIPWTKWSLKINAVNSIVETNDK